MEQGQQTPAADAADAAVPPRHPIPQLSGPWHAPGVATPDTDPQWRAYSRLVVQGFRRSGLFTTGPIATAARPARLPLRVDAEQLPAQPRKASAAPGRLRSGAARPGSLDLCADTGHYERLYSALPALCPSRRRRHGPGLAAGGTGITASSTHREQGSAPRLIEIRPAEPGDQGPARLKMVSPLVDDAVQRTARPPSYTFLDPARALPGPAPISVLLGR